MTPRESVVWDSNSFVDDEARWRSISRVRAPRR